MRHPFTQPPLANTLEHTGRRTPAAVQILAAACKELQAAYGRILWAKVAERLPGRTDSHCARAYDNLVKHKRVRSDAVAGTK